MAAGYPTTKVKLGGGGRKAAKAAPKGNKGRKMGRSAPPEGFKKVVKSR